MLVNSLVFWTFFWVVLCCYFTCFRKNSSMQNLWLLLASYFFYGYVNAFMCLLLLATTTVFYFIGIQIEKKREKDTSAWLLPFGILVGVGLLLYYKYTNFFLEQLSSISSLVGLKSNWGSLHILVPIGISFFTFKLISYLVEIHRGNIRPTRNFITFATYVAFFPTIMSGPIDKANDLIPQLERTRRWSNADVLEGLKRILWGMFLKMCIADKVSPYTDSVYNNFGHHSGITICVAAIMYSFQIYADFCGYSEMAIGVGRIMGIKITENFYRPMFATTVGEFWRRWHMSLMTWLKDYIYISLGGSRCSKFKAFRNTLATFLVSGFWHGANWTFVVWGLYHGFWVYVYKWLGFQPKGHLMRYIRAEYGNTIFTLTPAKESWVYRYVSIGIVFVICTLGWMVFRADSITHFILLLSRITAPGGLFFSWALTAVLPIAILLFKEMKDEEGWNIHFLHSSNIYVQAMSLALLFVYIFYTGELEGARFIYFQF